MMLYIKFLLKEKFIILLLILVIIAGVSCYFAKQDPKPKYELAIGNEYEISDWKELQPDNPFLEGSGYSARIIDLKDNWVKYEICYKIKGSLPPLVFTCRESRFQKLIIQKLK